MFLLIKRFFDFISALIAIIILSPLFIICILILSVTGEKEVFYKQKRIGKNNQIFGIWKFATMLKNSEKIGTGAITLRNDPRVTSFGKFLRMTKINELPQLINVLTGEMSLVGPRPLMEVSFDQYSDEVKAKIYRSTPGITGIGSIVFRDEEKWVSEADDIQKMYQRIYEYKGQLELWYLNYKSILVDIKILILTVLVVILPKGISVNSWFKGLPKNKDFGIE